MAVTYKKLPDEPITIITVTGLQRDGMLMPGPDDMDQEIVDIVEETPGKDYLIVDITNEEMNFSTLVMELSQARDEIRQLGKQYIDENICYVFVGSGNLADLAVKALKQEQYGGLETHLYPTLDTALDFAREQIRKENS